MIGWVLLVGCGDPVEPGPGRTAADMLDDLRVRVIAAEERRLVEGDVVRIEALGGSMEHVRNTLWVAVTRGCRGVCLDRVVAVVEDGMRQHIGDARAADRALSDLGVVAMSRHDAP